MVVSFLLGGIVGSLMVYLIAWRPWRRFRALWMGWRARRMLRNDNTIRGVVQVWRERDKK